MTAPNQTEGIDSGLYGDEEGQQPKSVDDKNAENPTGLIPKTLLGGKKFNVGDEVVLEIVADHGEEVEVQYAQEKPGEEGKTETESADDSELQSMNENY